MNGIAATGRLINLLRDNYIEPQFEALNEKVEYLITLVESTVPEKKIEEIKKELNEKKKKNGTA